MRAGPSELRAHCTEGGEKGRGVRSGWGWGRHPHLGRRSRGGKAWGSLGGSEPLGDAHAPQACPLCGASSGRASAPQSHPDLPFRGPR